MICNGRQRSAISIGNQSTSCPRHMETIKTLSGTVCDTIWIDRNSWTWYYFPNHYHHANKERLMERVSGTVCMRQSATNHRSFLLNHVSVTAQWELRLFLRLVVLLDLRSPTKYGNTCVMSATHRSQTVADRDRRPSPTVTDHMETRL